jgi:hypothetical protein
MRHGCCARSFGWRSARGCVKDLFIPGRYQAFMADAAPGALIGLKQTILRWLSSGDGAGSEPGRTPAGHPESAPPPLPSEPDRRDLGEGRGRVLYIRA